MEAREDNQPPLDPKYTFLLQITSGRPHHGKKSFFQHLCNVNRFLKSYSRSEELCNAGLFHAVYGTQFFSQDQPVSREVVRGYIGQYAEELVHIFCDLRKERFESIAENRLGWSAEQHLDLCWLEYANLWDHREKGGTIHERLKILSPLILRLEDGKARASHSDGGDDQAR